MTNRVVDDEAYVFYEDDSELLHRPRRWPLLKPRCSMSDKMAEHEAVVRDAYSKSGVLIGDHFRCNACGCVWNEGSVSEDLPDEDREYGQ